MSDLLHECLMFPWRGADKLLHPLVVAVFDIVLNRFDVLAALLTKQAREVMAGMVNAVHALPNEVVTILIAELHEVSGHEPQWGGFIFFYFAVSDAEELHLCFEFLKQRQK